MPTLETVRRITVEQRSTGGDAVRRDLLATADAQGKIGDAAEAAAVVAESASRRQLSAAGSFDRLRASVDANYRSHQSLERGVRALDRAFAQGVTDAAGYERTLGLLQARYNGVEQAAARAAAAQRQGWRDLADQGSRALENLEASRKLGGLGASAPTAANENRKLRSDQIQNLLYQGNDIFASMGSGSNLSTVAFQQGPQIAQVFGGPGGASVKGAFTQAGEAASSLASRVGIIGGAIGAVTAIVGTGVAALSTYSSQQKEIALSLAGMGRASGASVGQVNAAALASAGVGGVSVSSARDMAAEFAATGRIGSAMFGGLIEKARDYATTTRQDLPEATKALAEAFADPVKGAERLNAQLGFLTAESEEAIQRLDAQGNRLGAQRVLFEAFAGSVEKADARLGFFSRQWQEFSRNTSNEFDAIGRIVDRGLGGGDLETRLQTLQGQLDFRTRNRGAAGGLFDSLLGFDENQIRADIAKVRAEIDKAASQGRTADLAQRSLAVNRLVQGANPETEALKKAEDSATRIRTDLAAGVIDADGASRRTMLGFEDSARRIREDLAAGGSEMAAGLRRAQFDANQVGRSGLGRTSAEIENEFAERQRRLESQNLEPAKRFEQMQTMELERVTRLQTAQSEALRSETGRSGLINRAPADLRQHYLDAAAQTGVPLDLLLGVSYAESRFNPTAAANKNFPNSHAYGLMQLQPGTAREMGVDPTDPRQNILGGARYLRARLDQANGDEALAYGLYHDGPGTAGNSAAAQKAFADVQRFRSMPTTGQDIAGMDERARGLENENRLVGINSQFLGRNGEALESATRAQELLNRAIAQGREITPELRAEFEATAAGMARAARSLAGTRAGRDLEFDRDQLGRDRYDQTAYSKARSVFGDTSTPQAAAFVDEARRTAVLTDARSTFSDAVTGFATDLRRGASAADALSSAFGRVADKLISSALDSAVGGLFKAATGSGGLASLFPGFSSGGFTGPGDRLQPAGVVHAGEYVFDAASVRRFGVGTLDAMRSGLRGYADGGFVPMPDLGKAPVQPVASANSNGPSSPPTVNVINNGEPVQAQVQQRADGSLDVILDKLEARTAGKIAGGRGPMAAAVGAGRRLRG